MRGKSAWKTTLQAESLCLLEVSTTHGTATRCPEGLTEGKTTRNAEPITSTAQHQTPYHQELKMLLRSTPRLGLEPMARAKLLPVPLTERGVLLLVREAGEEAHLALIGDALELERTFQARQPEHLELLLVAQGRKHPGLPGAVAGRRNGVGHAVALRRQVHGVLRGVRALPDLQALLPGDAHEVILLDALHDDGVVLGNQVDVGREV
mmetsp:Transcript_114732/g.357332  ORF Transcript_114732/g.357332 Transcript_114732/m.357332 type:complete len:208 (+) Transcript_114732:81-704(+)